MKVVMGRDLASANAQRAAEIRNLLGQKKVTALNLISSPGSGKTTLLEQTALLAGNNLGLGVIVGDLYTDRDAGRLGTAGMTAVQINTEGICHLDAGMIARALEAFPLPSLDLLFIENVGNLVCPAAFDLGEHKKVAVLSVTEGNDKPAKYPAIFREAAATVINKSDLLPHTDFDLNACTEDLKEINPAMKIFVTSARTGEGMDGWCRWLLETTRELQEY